MQVQNYKMDFPSVIKLIVGFVIGQVICRILIYFCQKIFMVDTSNFGWFMILMYAVSMIVPIVFFDYTVCRQNGNKLRFNLSTQPFQVYLVTLPMMFGMMLMADVIVEQIPTTGKFLGELYKLYQMQLNSLGYNRVALVIMTVLLAPILEEVLFRGIIMKGMLNNGASPLKAILVSSFIFGFVHGYPWQFVGALLIGTVLGLVYYKTKSLLMPIFLHAVNNLLSALFVMYFDFQNFEGLFQIDNTCIFLIGLILFGLSFYIFTYRKNIIYKD